jgi:hypothetical protein
VPPPRTLRSPRHTPAPQRSQTPPTRSLYACDDDTTFSM